MLEGLRFFERLAKAREFFQEHGRFRKVSGDGLRFSYLPIEQAKPYIERAMAANGLSILPMSIELDDTGFREWDKTSQYGGAPTHWVQLRGTVRFRIAYGFGPDEYIDLDIMAEAMDNSDKAINKLYTMAYKTMAKIVFGYSESPNDDADATQEEIPAKAPAKPAAKPAPKRGQTASTDRFFAKPSEDMFFARASEVKEALAAAKASDIKEAKPAPKPVDIEVMDRSQLVELIRGVEQMDAKAVQEAVAFVSGEAHVAHWDRLDLEDLRMIARGLSGRGGQ